MRDHALFVFDVLYRRIPDFSCPLDHQPFHVLCGFDGGPTGGEGGPAAPGDGGETDGVGVHHSGFNVLIGNPQHLGSLHGDSSPGASDVHRARDEAYGAVGVHSDCAAGLESCVKPEPRGHAPAPVFAPLLDGGLGMFVVFGRLQALYMADAPECRAFDAACPLLSGVAQTKLDGVHAQLLTDLINHLLYGKGRLGGARGAIGGGLGLVHHHIVTVNPAIGIVIAAEGAHGALHHRRAWVGPGLIS